MAEKPVKTVPKWLNTLMTLVLRSPLHGLVSSKIMLISFEGRTSGKQFTTPVSYMQTGEAVTLFTHAHWWRNLVGDKPVMLRIRGKMMKAKAEAIIADQQAVAEGLSEHLLHNHFDAQFYDVHYDVNGRPVSADVRRGAEGVVMVRFRPA